MVSFFAFKLTEWVINIFEIETKENKLKQGVITINLDKVKEYYTEEYAKFIVSISYESLKYYKVLVITEVR